jgi:hypothetical protein
VELGSAPYGAISVAVFGEGNSRLAIGSYNSFIIVELGSDGAPVKTLSKHALPVPATRGYVPLSVGLKSIYYKGAGGTLAYCLPGTTGAEFIDGKTALEVQAIGSEIVDGNLVVACGHTFKDAVHGDAKVDGFVLNKIAIETNGSVAVDQDTHLPRKIFAPGRSRFRKKCTLIVTTPAPVALGAPLEGFLGNSVSNLSINVSILALNAKEATVRVTLAGQGVWEGPLSPTPNRNSSGWIKLDAFLQDHTGTALARIDLSNIPNSPPVPEARLQFEFAQTVNGIQQPLRTATTHILGTVAVLLVPYYGLDDPTALPARIQTATEHFQKYRDIAAKGAQSGGFSGRPKRTVVKSYLIGLDASPEALDAGLEALKLLGTNAAYVSGFQSLALDRVQAAVTRIIGDSWLSVGDSELYFAYAPPINDPQTLKSWVGTRLVDRIKSQNIPLDRVVISQFQDEPAWYYPEVVNRISNPQDNTNKKALALFQAYLESTGLPATHFGRQNTIF